MNTIHISKVQISPHRQRREHNPDTHQELVESIRTQGLFHPPVLRAEGDQWFLVAGERRLRALTDVVDMWGGEFRHNGSGYCDGIIPFVTLGELSPLAAEEAELEENIRRDDLTWQERVDAEARLVRLRDTQAKARGEHLPHLGDIAKEIRGGDTPGGANALSQSILLSLNMHRPEVKEAKSVRDAMKALARVEQRERDTEMAAALGKEYLGDKHKVYNEDCLDFMTTMTEGTYDVILTDPPYGMGADEFGDSGGGAAGAHRYDDGYETWQSLLDSFADLSISLTKPDAHCYLFCDFDRFHELKGLMEAVGWKVFRTPLIWFTPTKFRAPWPEQGPQRKYECILYAVKGDMKCTKLAGDVLTYPMDENLGHQAQKPVALFQDLMSRSARPGMRVLDPFCGSGPVFPAAHALSVIATGIEKDPASYALSVKRLQVLKGK